MRGLVWRAPGHAAPAPWPPGRGVPRFRARRTLHRVHASAAPPLAEARCRQGRRARAWRCCVTWSSTVTVCPRAMTSSAGWAPTKLKRPCAAARAAGRRPAGLQARRAHPAPPCSEAAELAELFAQQVRKPAAVALSQPGRPRGRRRACCVPLTTLSNRNEGASRSSAATRQRYAVTGVSWSANSRA